MKRSDRTANDGLGKSGGAIREEGDLLDRPIHELAPDLLGELADSFDEADTQNVAGRRIGAYRLERLIGRGGMGVVYEASRDDEQFEKQVAIKLLPRGLEGPEMKRRFRIERQILASLEHPSIARLIDGGLTDEGFPYLVMELVEGRSIDRFCREENLSPRACLKLFLQVCAGVQHAHQKLVVHRDLKPGNILVTADNGPKLLDFGVAKLLREEDEHQTLCQPMTLDYASPEQISNLPVSTASDVYSLGVVLYELLTGSKPYSLRGRSPAELQEIATRRETRAPSESVVANAESDLTAAERRRLSKQLQGDLDNIVLKALRKEPERRYGSVAALADDINRYLEGRPVSARPNTLRYRTAKFVGRHHLGVATTAVFVLLVTIGVAQIVHQGRVARQERDRAEMVAGFVTDLMRISDPDLGEGTTITARELLDKSRLRAETELTGQPEIQARILGVIADGYRNLGIYDQAAEVFSRIVDLLSPQSPGSVGQLAATERKLGMALASSGQVNEGVAHLERAIELRRQHYGAPDTVLAGTMVDLASALGYHLPNEDPRRLRIEPLLREAIAISRQAHGGDSESLASALHLLGLELVTQSLAGGEIDQALATEAENNLQEALAMRKRLFGERSVPVAETLNDMSLAIDSIGRHAEGADLMAEALALHRELMGPEHPDSIKMAENLGAFRFEQGLFEQARDILVDCLVQLRKIHPEDDIEMAPALYWLARSLLALGDLDGAELQAQRDISVLETDTAGNRIHAARGVLGEVYLARGDYEKAEPLIVGSYEALQQSLGAVHPLALQAEARMARLHERTGTPASTSGFERFGDSGNSDRDGQ